LDFTIGPRNRWRNEVGLIVEPDDAEVNNLYCERPERFDRLVVAKSATVRRSRLSNRFRTSSQFAITASSTEKLTWG
jgi:hypothetical protein